MSALRKTIVGCILIILLPNIAISSNIEEAGVLYNKAVAAIKAGEDSSVRNRFITAAIELDPESPNANWLMLWSSNWVLRGEGRLSSRAPGLAKLTLGVDYVKKLAEKRGEMALYHYIQARYLSAYSQFDKALEEIDKSLMIEPTSSRYLYVKADILADKGLWHRDEVTIWTLKSNEILENMLTANLTASKHINEYDIYFKLAYNEAKLKQGNHQNIINNYLKSLKSEGAGVNDHYVWNNMSIAYLKMNDCQNAFDAAKKAIEEGMQRSKRKGFKYSGFGAAETNLRVANYCLEMQKMGVL